MCRALRQKPRGLAYAATQMQALATELLQQLIRFNTVNPPGNERAAQEHLAGRLREAGFEVELAGRTPERPNLVARLRGRAEGPVLGLLSHVDTVLADPEDWQRDPWGGEVVEGELWGRGAQDMKSQTAAEVAAAITLANDGWRPARGDLLVLVMVDEETGGAEGAHWLTTERPDLCRCDFLLNEGGGSVMRVGEQAAYGVSIAEKGVFRFTLTTRGEAGHASMPGVADNALPKLAPLLAALGDPPEAWAITDAPRGLLAGLGYGPLSDDDPGPALARFRADAPEIAAFVDPMSSVTFAATRAGASEKINVIPARAWVKVDCRTPPGMGREGAEAHIRAALEGLDYELTFDEQVVGNASAVETPLMDALRGWIAHEEPDAVVVPTMIPAFTDSRHFRDAFPECVAYGFFPQRHKTLPEMWRMMHARDERIDVRDLAWAARCYHDVTKELLG